jgi:monoamine oxidase
VVNWGTMIDQQLEGGTKALLEAIENDAPAVDIRLGTPVASVEQSGEQVTVTTVEGDHFIADGVVVALPVNCWKDVQFDPPLSSDKVNGAALQPGTRGAKTWALVENAPSGFLGYANIEAGRGLTTLNHQAEVDGYQLMFGLSPVGKRDGIADAFDPLDKTHVQRAVEAFIPGAKVLEVDGEDWNTSPWSNGSWSTFRIGQMEYLSGMRRPEGRLAFAGSDICRGWLSWIDGAIESGTYAAAELDRIISSD